MTSREIHDRYSEMAVELAAIIGKIDDMKGQSEYISRETKDNGDPSIDLSEALEKLGVALANIITYADEYLNDAEKEESGE
jgi:hypothetical protein